MDQTLRILDRAQGLGLSGIGGACGEAALAINDVLFRGRGRLVGIVNKYLWRERGRFAGHVLVVFGDCAWDAEGVWQGGCAELPKRFPPGEDGLTLREWGMVDSEDPDYAVPNERAAEEVDAIALSRKDVRKIFRVTDGSERAIREAMVDVLGVSSADT